MTEELGFGFRNETGPHHAIDGPVNPPHVPHRQRLIALDASPELRQCAVTLPDGLGQIPILMTTCATILAALPLALATGAGAAGRQQIGVVLIGGFLVSIVVTLFLVPSAYVILSGRMGRQNVEAIRDTISPTAVSADCSRLC